MTAMLLDERADGVLRLTLNRPEARNALSVELMTALVEARGRAAEDRAARVIVIAGAGPAFCAGHDLRELRADPRRETYEHIFALCSELMLAIVRLPKPVVASIDTGQILGVRAGSEPHRFIGVWVVVVNGRVFVRPWNDNPGGWHRSLLEDPRGAIRPGSAKRAILVRARPARGERLYDAIDAAYARKYDTKASQKWVRGLAVQRRRKTTMELLPR